MLTFITEFEGNKYKFDTNLENRVWSTTLSLDEEEIGTVDHKLPLFKEETKRDNGLAKRIMANFGKSRHDKYLAPIYAATKLAKKRANDFEVIRIADEQKIISAKEGLNSYIASMDEKRGQALIEAAAQKEADKEQLCAVLRNESGAYTSEEIIQAQNDLKALMLDDMWYIHGENAKTGTKGHVVLNKLVIAEYLSKAYNLIKYNAKIWRYDWQLAYYTYDNNDEMIDQAISKIFKEVGNDEYKYNGNNLGDKANIIDQAASINTYTENPFNNNAYNVINTRSGVLEFDYDTRTVKLLGKRPEYMFSYCIDCEYNENADPTEMEAIIKNIVDYDLQGGKSQLEYIYLIPALAVRHINLRLTPPKVCYVFLGERNTGKTIVHGFYSNLLGESVISRIGLKDIVENKFSKPMLEGKLLNLDDELPEVLHSAETREIKTITGSKPQYLEPKNQKPYTGFITAILLFAGNQFPKCYVPKSATVFYERFDVIFFRHVFSTDDTFADGVYTKNNMSAFLNKVIDKLFDLHDASKVKDVENPGFKRNVPMKDIYEIWQNSSNLTHKFVRDAMTVAITPVEHDKKQFFNTYSAWCDAHDIPKDDARRMWNINALGKELIQCNFAKDTRDGNSHKWQMMLVFKAQWVLPTDINELNNLDQEVASSVLYDIIESPN